MVDTTTLLEAVAALTTLILDDQSLASRDLESSLESSRYPRGKFSDFNLLYVIFQLCWQHFQNIYLQTETAI